MIRLAGKSRKFRRAGGNILATHCCTVEADVPNGQVQGITEDLRFRFREAYPQISKASIHAGSRNAA